MKHISSSMMSSRSSYRPEIDGLRAFAILTVIINHFNKDILPGGYLGVDIFFVISGFVITSSLYKKPSKNFKEFIIGFYERRVKRLVPALSVFILLTSLVICMFNPEAGVSLRTGITSLFGVSNFYLLNQSVDYFAKSTELNPFTHTWSLGVEEQFYLLFPFLIWFSGFGKNTKYGARNLFLIIGSLTIASLIGFLYLYKTNQDASYFLMPARFWEMSSGCLLFILLQKKKYTQQFLEKVPSLLLLPLIIGIMFLPISWRALSTIFIVFLSSMLIGSLKKESIIFKLFTHQKVVYLGLISYSLYLWHWSVLSISRWTIGIYWWSIPFQLALIFILAITSYKWIENPLRKKSWFVKEWKSLLVGIGVLISVSINLFIIGKTFKGKLFFGNQFNKWNLKIFKDISITHSSNLPTIYLLGDSHAGHYGAVMTHLTGKKEYNFVMHPQGSGLKLIKKKGMEEYILAPLREYKNKFKKDDIVIFSAIVGAYKDKNLTKNYEILLEQTKKIGMRFFLISPTPIFSGAKEGDTCQEEWFRPSWAISENCFFQIKKSEWLDLNDESIKEIKTFLSRNPKVMYVDTFSKLCPDTFCKNHDELYLLYRDQNHLSSHGSMKTLNTFKLVLDQEYNN